jgi:hypothetical protein
VAEKLVRYRETPYRQRSRQSPTYSFANAQKEHISPIYVPCKLMAEADGSGFASCRIGNAASWPLIDDGYTISGGQTEWLGIDEREHAIRSQRLATLPHYEATHELKYDLAVPWLCDALGVSWSGFHAWLNRSAKRQIPQ